MTEQKEQDSTSVGGHAQQRMTLLHTHEHNRVKGSHTEVRVHIRSRDAALNAQALAAANHSESRSAVVV